MNLLLSNLSGAGDTRGACRSTFWKIANYRLNVVFRRNRQARNYQIQLHENGTLGVVIPHRGSVKKARKFAREHQQWIAQKVKESGIKKRSALWKNGTRILFRGVETPLVTFRSSGVRMVRLGNEVFELKVEGGDLRTQTLVFLARLAQLELPLRVAVLAKQLGVSVSSVRVKNQKSRWGSCSAKGVVALNWRLVLMPLAVRDYVIVHELVHRMEMSHSERFWKLVAKVCPRYQEHELWLKNNRARVCL